MPALATLRSAFPQPYNSNALLSGLTDLSLEGNPDSNRSIQ